MVLVDLNSITYIVFAICIALLSVLIQLWIITEGVSRGIDKYYKSHNKDKEQG